MLFPPATPAVTERKLRDFIQYLIVSASRSCYGAVTKNRSHISHYWFCNHSPFRGSRRGAWNRVGSLEAAPRTNNGHEPAPFMPPRPGARCPRPCQSGPRRAGFAPSIHATYPKARPDAEHCAMAVEHAPRTGLAVKRVSTRPADLGTYPTPTWHPPRTTG